MTPTHSACRSCRGARVTVSLNTVLPCPVCHGSGVDRNPLPVLVRLAGCRDALAELTASRERLIAEALSEGHSERKVGEAAGLSGVAIHNRKAA